MRLKRPEPTAFEKYRLPLLLILLFLTGGFYYIRPNLEEEPVRENKLSDYTRLNICNIGDSDDLNPCFTQIGERSVLTTSQCLKMTNFILNSFDCRAEHMLFSEKRPEYCNSKTAARMAQELLTILAKEGKDWLVPNYEIRRDRANISEPESQKSRLMEYSFSLQKHYADLSESQLERFERGVYQYVISKKKIYDKLERCIFERDKKVLLAPLEIFRLAAEERDVFFNCPTYLRCNYTEQCTFLDHKNSRKAGTCIWFLPRPPFECKTASSSETYEIECFGGQVVTLNSNTNNKTDDADIEAGNRVRRRVE